MSTSRLVENCRRPLSVSAVQLFDVSHLINRDAGWSISPIWRGDFVQVVWACKTRDVIKKNTAQPTVSLCWNSFFRLRSFLPASYSSSRELLSLLFTCLLHLWEAELSVIVVSPGHSGQTSGWAGEAENKSGVLVGLGGKRWRLVFHCRALAAGLKHPSRPPLMRLGEGWVGFRTP